MNRLSLRLRSFAAALVVLILFIPITVITLEQAFTNGLSQSMLEQLRVQSLTLISEFELEDDQTAMPEQLFNDQLNIPGSGLYAFITVSGDLAWQSLSTLNWQRFPALQPPPVGDETFDTDVQLASPFFLYAYTAEFPTAEGFAPVTFFILQDKRTFDAEITAFANTLWYWLGLTAVFLLALLLASLNAALRPMNHLIDDIRDAEAGKTQHIDRPFPPELEKLKTSINHLLSSERQQRERYKNSLSDLAHSLKTPLAVLSGNKQIPEVAREPLHQIDAIIQRQLKRAVAGAGSGWEQAVEVAPVVNKLFAAMAKVYADKSLQYDLEVSAEVRFRGDNTDLMEMLGNLIDNACKAAQSQIRVRAEQREEGLRLYVEDDGPGIEPQHRLTLLARGKRLDSYQEGQGIGMAVVADLVAAYQGQLDITDSTLGGACIQLTF